MLNRAEIGSLFQDEMFDKDIGADEEDIEGADEARRAAL